ncbi:MAG: nuclear transport factor 2 family protein [Candidatus Hydrogenedentes bacterium]|nr:nuclear transport factor 2 family protein [Candidatus Hydrogenedentota bacterium]
MPPRDVVNAMYTAFAEKDEARLRVLLATDVEWEQMRGMPGGAHRHGVEEVIRDVLRGLNTIWNEFQVHLENWIVDGESVVVTGRYTGVHAKTGRPLDAPFAHWYTVRGEQVTRFVQFTDTAVFVNACRKPDAHL